VSVTIVKPIAKPNAIVVTSMGLSRTAILKDFNGKVVYEKARLIELIST
jgi:hypothetical protein